MFTVDYFAGLTYSNAEFDALGTGVLLGGGPNTLTPCKLKLKDNSGVGTLDDGLLNAVNTYIKLTDGTNTARARTATIDGVLDKDTYY